jgi:hypothetical protein
MVEILCFFTGWTKYPRYFPEISFTSSHNVPRNFLKMNYTRISGETTPWKVSWKQVPSLYCLYTMDSMMFDIRFTFFSSVSNLSMNPDTIFRQFLSFSKSDLW